MPACEGRRVARRVVAPVLEQLEPRRLLTTSAGTIWSGVYSTNLTKLDLLASNLGSVNHMVKFGQVDAYDVFISGGITGGHTISDSKPPLYELSGTAKDDQIVVAIAADNTFTASVNGKQQSVTSAGRLIINANAGDDFVLIKADPASTMLITIYGAAGNDTIIGSTGKEKIFAGDGNDFVLAANGNDTVYGDAGDDTLRGGAQSDLLDGGAGNDLVRGDAGNDNLSGGEGSDRLRGSAGDDLLFGGASRDFIGGEAGTDLLFGEGGNDVLAGGPDTDSLNGGAGDDDLDGNDGDDVLAGEGGRDTFNLPANDAATDGDANDYVWNSAADLAANPNVQTQAGMHRLLQFDLVTTKIYSRETAGGSTSTKTVWLLNSNYLVFQDQGRGDA
jgi:Ca2+-binding RTX toxin-like protein